MTQKPDAPEAGERWAPHRVLGLIAGPALALAMLVLPPPPALSAEGWTVAAVAALMAVWWMTEALPLAATALVPLVLLPLLGIAAFDHVAGAYADPLIFLFLGGFLLARALARWNLDRRIAFSILALGGTEPRTIVLSVMVATAFLSLWVSNTATTMMMLPIGLSLAKAVEGDAPSADSGKFATALLLGIAYGASIGGWGTLVGTPPNALLAAYLRESQGIEIGFARWMLLGVPLVLVMLPIAWLVLVRLAFPFELPALSHTVLEPLRRLPPLERGGRLTALLLAVTALAWLARPLLDRVAPGLALSDAGIAVTAAVLLFLVPADFRGGRFLLTWDDAVKLPWGVLILFGGGLALAQSISESGLAAWIGQNVGALSALPLFVFVLAMAAVIVLLGELASNTAIAAIFLPVAGATAAGLGLDPVMLALPVALAATVGFMLPVGTPPNAIVFGSGRVTSGEMLRAGALLDLLGVILVSCAALTLGFWIFAPE